MSCCTADERCNAQTSACEPLSTPEQLERCYAPAAFGADSFTSEPALLVDEDGYEYLANHEVDAPFAQTLSVALWPLSASTAIEGTFDLSQEPFSYASCERCVLVIAGRSAEDQKYYLAREGTLSITEVGARRIAGSLANVRLAEVVIDERTLATSLVGGGCELEIPSLSFEYGEPDEPLDPHVEQCFLPGELRVRSVPRLHLRIHRQQLRLLLPGDRASGDAGHPVPRAVHRGLRRGDRLLLAGWGRDQLLELLPLRHHRGENVVGRDEDLRQRERNSVSDRAEQHRDGRAS
jgi:hypothetical protein